MSQQQRLPFGYLSQIESYLATVYPPSTSSATSPATHLPPAPLPLPCAAGDIIATVETTATPANTGNLPDCFLTRRCDSCEMLFAEASPDEQRFTYPCGHVYCAACAGRAAAAARRNNVHIFCRRCSNIIVRKRDNVPCTHQIPVVAFDPRKPVEGATLMPDRYRLALGQRTGPKCQLCWLVTRLQNVTYQLSQRYRFGGMFPGEVFACVQVDRNRIVHGLRNELPGVEVNEAEDVELCRTSGGLRQELSDLAEEICGGLGQVPMEPNFDPRGDVVVQYRLRGFAAWMRRRGGGERAMPTALRAAVYGDWGGGLTDGSG